MRRNLAAIAVAVAMTAGARADARPRAAILDMLFEGVPRDVSQQFETVIEEGLRKVGYDVVTHDATVEAIAKRDLAEGCTFGPCVGPIARAVDADRMIDARVAAAGQSYSFVLSMLDGRTGAPVAQVVGSCPVCTVAEALSKVGASIEVLEGQKNAPALPSLVTREAPRRHRSKALPAVLAVVGTAAAIGGGLLVARTEHDAAGWVTIGSGGTVALTGLILLVGD